MARTLASLGSTHATDLLHMEDNPESLLSMGLTPTLHLPMQDPCLDSCPAPCYLSSHLRPNTIELILPYLAPIPHHLGFRISLHLPWDPYSRRTDQHTYLPDLMVLSLLALEEMVDTKITGKLLANPTPILTEG